MEEQVNSGLTNNNIITIVTIAQGLTKYCDLSVASRLSAKGECCGKQLICETPTNHHDIL